MASIEPGLRADAFRNRLLNKNLLSTKGSLYNNGDITYEYYEDTAVTDETSFEKELEKNKVLYILTGVDEYTRVDYYAGSQTYYVRKSFTTPEALLPGAANDVLYSINKKLVWKPYTEYSVSCWNGIKSNAPSTRSVTFSKKNAYAHFSLVTNEASVEAVVLILDDAGTELWRGQYAAIECDLMAVDGHLWLVGYGRGTFSGESYSGFSNDLGAISGFVGDVKIKINQSSQYFY